MSEKILDQQEEKNSEIIPEDTNHSDNLEINNVSMVLRNAYHFYDICSELNNPKGILKNFDINYVKVLIENLLMLPDYVVPIKFIEVNKKEINKVYKKGDFFKLFAESYFNTLTILVNSNLEQIDNAVNFANEMELYAFYQTLEGKKNYNESEYFEFFNELVNYMLEYPLELWEDNIKLDKKGMINLCKLLTKTPMINIEGSKIEKILLEEDSSSYNSLFKKIVILNSTILENSMEIMEEKLSSHRTVEIFNPYNLKKINEDIKLEEFPQTINKINTQNSKYIIDNTSITEKLDSLRMRFPIFEKFIDFVENESFLNSIGDNLFQLPPSLLVGEPGIGKTFFLKELSLAANVEEHFFNMGTITGSIELAGSNPSWMNSSMGQVLSKLLDSSMINPLFILDEIDKLSHGTYPIMPVLLSLLEKHTSKSFKDEFIGYPCDLSKIVFLATANNLEIIDKPLLSRMSVFNIPSPNMEQRKVFAKQVYSAICKERKLEGVFSKDLNDEYLEILCKADNSTRDLKRTITYSLSNASRRNIDKKGIILTPEDYHIDIEKKKPIGFV